MEGLSRRQAMGAAFTTLASPVAAAVGGVSGNRRETAKPLIAYLRSNGASLLRPAQGLFRHPSIAPSLPKAQYSAELWDWDTLWTARGLFALARSTNDQAFHRRVVEHTKGSLLNILDNQSAQGRLPIVMASTDADANRFPFDAEDRNQAKPVMAQMALLATDEGGDAAWCAPLIDKLKRFHESWLAHNESRTGLIVWSNDVAIGNDNDPTTFGRPPFSSANLLLNCLFYQDLRALALLSKRLGRPASEQAELSRRSDRLGRAVLDQCWDERDAFFYSVDVQCVDRRAELIPNVERGMDMSWSTIPLRIQQFTGFLPMWCGLATAEQARAMVTRNYLADDRLRAAHGIRTLANRERMYSLAFTSNPSNWLGPVWIISNYLTWRALGSYGFREEANDLADKTIELLASSLRTDGNLNEYYHPDSGKPLSHQGFMNWNLLALEML